MTTEDRAFNTSKTEEILKKLDGEFISGTTNATPDTETVHAHELGRTPRGFMIISKDKAGDVYDSSSHSDTQLKIKCAVASVAFTAYVF
jgi:hypothetical protein